MDWRGRGPLFHPALADVLEPIKPGELKYAAVQLIQLKSKN